MNKTLVALALSTALVSTQGYADAEPGPYLAASFGQATVQDPVKALDLAYIVSGAYDFSTGPIVVTEDDTDSAWRLTWGYQMDSMWAVEVSYADLGETYARARSSGIVGTMDGPVAIDTTAQLSFKATVLSLGAVFGADLGDRFRFSAKIGAFHFNTDAQIDVTASGTLEGVTQSFSGRDSEEDSGSSIYAGLGLGFALAPQWSLLASYDRYTDIESGGEESDVDTMMLSLQHRF